MQPAALRAAADTDVGQLCGVVAALKVDEAWHIHE